jgi:hypothetical protein
VYLLAKITLRGERGTFIMLQPDAYDTSDRSSFGLDNEVPALAHSRGQRLFAHIIGLHPFSQGRTRKSVACVVGVIAEYTELVYVHSEPYVSEDVHQWRKSSDMRELSILLANAEA